MRSYEPNPHYSPVGGEVSIGWPAALQHDVFPHSASGVVLAIDGPMCLDWTMVVQEIAMAIPPNCTVSFLDMREAALPWSVVQHLTETPELADDPDFAMLPRITLAEIFGELPIVTADPGHVSVVFGPGASLVSHNVLWYADLPKRYAEAHVVGGGGRNLGQRAVDGPSTTKYLFYVDWPLLDQHRDSIAPSIDRFLDTQDSRTPKSLPGSTLRATLEKLVGQPFRTRPTFNTTSWGGNWAQQQLGMNPDARNTALGYELIAPESGVLIGDSPDAVVEVPFQLLVALHPAEVLGPDVQATFGTSFPIRFDYLDTVNGGNLSVHCHPQLEYMRDVFGWPYTQHETYYMMVGAPDNKVFLGIRDSADVDEFHRAAHDAHHAGVEFDIERYVQTFPATPHQLFVIPAGTPHGSGEGNVVLEVSATPYLYSLRFFDWLRRDSDGTQRPVHVERAFANLNTNRSGDAVKADLVQNPRDIRSGPHWREELLGALPEMFFEVRRIVIDSNETVTDNTAARFHVLNVVEGEGVEIETTDGLRQTFAYAETIIVPASVGSYKMTCVGQVQVRLVKALVP